MEVSFGRRDGPPPASHEVSPGRRCGRCRPTLKIRAIPTCRQTRRCSLLVPLAASKRNQRSSRTPQASPLTCGGDCRRIDPTDGLYSRRCGFRVAREATLNLARVPIQAHTTTWLPASRHRLRARSAPHHRQERKQWSTAEAPCDGEPQRRTTGRVASGRTPASERARCGMIPGAGRGLRGPGKGF